MVLIDLMEGGHELARYIQKRGPQVTITVDTAQQYLLWDSGVPINEDQIAGALLFMVLTPDRKLYQPGNLIMAIRNDTELSINWETVVRGFDRNGVAVEQDQFLALYIALLPIAKEDHQFDIQTLWGGNWQNPATQLSFVLAFLSLSSSQLDATTIPSLRLAYNPSECADGPEEVVMHIQDAKTSTMISVDAVTALIHLVWDANDPPSPEDTLTAKEIIAGNIGFFLCSAIGTPKPWSQSQQAILERMISTFLAKQQATYSFVLHSLWKQDKQWVAGRLVAAHTEDPLKLPMILEHAEEHGWLDELCTMINGLGIDLAALAHRKGLLDINQWVEDRLSPRPPLEFTMPLSKFLSIKAQDEIRTVRGEQLEPSTVRLAVKTAAGMLDVLAEQYPDDLEQLVKVQRQCIQAYPRLINYGEGFDDIIDMIGEDDNSLSPETDAEMQDLYKRMYGGEMEVRHIIEVLQEFKTSRDPSRQDLFACMIHGLFDEYVCFGEYPLPPLATTAVLFGGLISCRILANLSLRVGLGMVLEAVRDYSAESSMYKFGLQALLHFLERLPEWPDYCASLAQVPGLEGTEAHRKVFEVLNQNDVQSAPNGEAKGVDNVPNGVLTNGDLDDLLTSDAMPRDFRSINAGEPILPDPCETPNDHVQDKVRFVLNNVTKQDLTVKLDDLRGTLEARHHQWFASYLVEERAKFQPNYQELYLELLDGYSNKVLWAIVLRETYISIEKLFNAPLTMNTPTERSLLSNLATWLGSLTIARDKPIKHKNISFKDLLLEAHETQRLILAIPFTCKVLLEARKSVVFRPPNPWLMDIIGVLLELYEHVDLKTNLKFSIEILMRDLKVNVNNVKVSTEIRDRLAFEDELQAPILPDGLEGFEDLSLGGINRGPRNPRLSPNAIAATLPDIGPLLVFPPSSGSPANQARLREIVLTAIHRAIVEIIAPVVERSVTIATIAASNIIHKDFVREADEERVRQSAHRMVQTLAGSLGLVTCKEPLRMSMTNYMRSALVDLPDQSFPEGTLLMCVNDNLDVACSVVEHQAEERALPEIEAHVEVEIAKRRFFAAERPNEPFSDQDFSPWANHIPDPYKQNLGGLGEAQLALYLEFARQTRGPASHIQSGSTDSGRQLPDVLQDVFPAIPNLPTPAEPPAMPHPPIHAQSQDGRMLPPPLTTTQSRQQTNGYADTRSIQERVQDLLAELSHVCSTSQGQALADVARDHPVIDVMDQLFRCATTSSGNIEDPAFATASMICTALYRIDATDLETQALVHILHRLCQISQATDKEVTLWLMKEDDYNTTNPVVTKAFLETGLLDFEHVDRALAKAIYDHRLEAVDCLSEIVDDMVINSCPTALRADFANSLGALGHWMSIDDSIEVGKGLMRRLRQFGVPEGIESKANEQGILRQRQMLYVFEEWASICDRPDSTDKTYAVFISQLHQKQLLNSTEDMVFFFRLCIDTSIETFEKDEFNPNKDTKAAFYGIDCLARLVVLLVKHQGEDDGAVKASKPAYMNAMLGLLILVLNNHHVMRGEHLNQRVFFRLFSTILCDWHDMAHEGRGLDREILQVFANNFFLIGPKYLPGFTWGWIFLVSHRLFMGSLLKSSDEAVRLFSIITNPITNNSQGWEPYAKIVEQMLSFVGKLMTGGVVDRTIKELYSGVFRIILLLRHDFAEFLAANHFRLCNAIPTQCPQLRNVILSTYPGSFTDLPDPFTGGLKVDRLEDMRKVPKVSGDIAGPLTQANIKNLVDSCLEGHDLTDETVTRMANAAFDSKPQVGDDRYDPETAKIVFFHALVLYVGEHAISAAGQKGGPSFNSNGSQASLMKRLAKELPSEARYYFLGAIVNQLRYPNSHTQWFSYVLLHLFGTDFADQQESDIRQQISRVLLERLIVHRPHPWGLVITMLELLKNPVYMFHELPFIKAAPEVSLPV